MQVAVEISSSACGRRRLSGLSCCFDEKHSVPRELSRISDTCKYLPLCAFFWFGARGKKEKSVTTQWPAVGDFNAKADGISFSVLNSKSISFALITFPHKSSSAPYAISWLPGASRSLRIEHRYSSSLMSTKTPIDTSGSRPQTISYN